MSTTVTLTVGIFPPGKIPIFTSRRVIYTDLTDPLTSLSTILTTPPFLQYVPVPPEPEPAPAPEPVPEEVA